MEGEDWTIKHFDQCAELLRETVHPSDVRGLPYVGLEHIAEGQLALSGHGSADQVTSIKSRFRKGEILFGKLRPYFRKVVIAPFDGVCSTDIWVVRPRQGIDQRYLFYWMASYEFIEESTRASEGTRMPRAQWDFVSRIKKRVPPLQEQRAIANILGALDDKIELNRRMNETLEAIAQAIFKSWFVDAAREGLPEGWRVGTLKDAISIHDSKRIPLSGRQRAERQGKYPYYGAASAMDHVDDFLFDGVYVLIGEDGSVVNDDDSPVLQYVWGKFWVNNHAHVLTGRNGISVEHLFLFMKTVNIRPFVTGAVQPKLNQGNLCRIPFTLPPESVNQDFARLIAPLFARIRANDDQSRTLAALRDALLPKLISGELRVKDVERIAGRCL